MKTKLLIYSGGMDSTTMLHHYKDEIALTVSFNYGSNHNEKEIAFAKKNSEELGIEHLVIDLKDTMKHFKSGLLNGAEEIPEGHYSEESMAKTVVPFRNGVMISIAVGIANSRNLSAVMLANHFGDDAQYPDCRGRFIEAMNFAVNFGTDHEVRLHAPYTGLTKEAIAELGSSLGINYATTWSCYKADSEKHCGKCGTCVERIWALRNLEDPTEYLDKEFAVKLLKEKGEW